jgi:MoaA/NifB/PqqE/SkfB family radical SAM enzyme
MKPAKWARQALRAAWNRTAAVNFIVTRRCDLACSYCHAVYRSPEIAPADWIRIAGKLAHRYAAFTITGGEPLVYKGLPEVVEAISRIGIAGLCSNVRTIEESHLLAMPGLDYLNFSIDYAIETAGDVAASRKTAFGKLPLLAEYAARQRFELMGTAVITARNVEEIPAIVEELGRYRIPLNLQLVQNPGPEDAFDTPAKLATLARLQLELAALKRAGALIDEADDYLAGMVPFVRGETEIRCHAGRVYLAVETDGRLKPCLDTPAVGRPLTEIEDVDAALDALPGAVPDGCRCWWNCYQRYETWAHNPWNYLLQAGLERLKGQPGLSS